MTASRYLVSDVRAAGPHVDVHHVTGVDGTTGYEATCRRCGFIDAQNYNAGAYIDNAHAFGFVKVVAARHAVQCTGAST